MVLNSKLFGKYSINVVYKLKWFYLIVFDENFIKNKYNKIMIFFGWNYYLKFMSSKHNYFDFIVRNFILL